MPAQRRRAIIASVVAIAVLALVVVVSNAMISGRRPAAAPATSPPASLPTTAPPSQSAAPVSSPAAAPSSDPPKPLITITAVGDLELGNTPDLPADPASYLSHVHEALAAPIVFANLEGTLTNATSRKCAPPTPTATPTPTPAATSPSASPKPTATSTSPAAPASASPTKPPPPPTCYAFRTPPSYASVLRNAGFTVLNSANNHAHDFGSRGVADTSAALQAAHIAQTGLPGQVAVVNANGVRVALIGFAPYAGANNLLDTEHAQELISSAKHAADLVVVYMHAGAEGSAATHVTGEDEHYLGEDRGNPQQFAHMAIDAGADLVLGSGPHVLRGMEYYRGHLIAYSLGDFAGYHNFATTGTLALSGILRVSLSADGRAAAANFTSTILSSSGRPALDPRNEAATLMNQLSAADFGTSAARIGPTGTLRLP